MDNAPVMYSIALYCLFVLLPIVPAVILFKMFPDTKVAVRGPLQNLTLKATGAFAGYVVTAILGFFLIQNVVKQIDQMGSSAWTVVVPVKLIDTNAKGIAQLPAVDYVNFDPKFSHVGDQDLYVSFPHREIDDWPTMSFSMPGFSGGAVDLQRLVAANDEKVATIDRAERKIVVKEPVTLNALGQALTGEYKESKPLEAIDETPHK